VQKRDAQLTLVTVEHALFSASYSLLSFTVKLRATWKWWFDYGWLL